MNTKSCILAVFISLLPISSFAQVEAEIHRPSINAEQFGFASKAEAALNKGQLSVNIPLMTLKGKGYDLPISLTFYNGDVTSCTEASPVGLGWALMAGGVITSTIRGKEDIEAYMVSGQNEYLYDSAYIENIRNDEIKRNNFIDEIRYNSMPDEYRYSLPGHSGTIEVSIDNHRTVNRTLFPDESYKIDKTTAGYCITADDGNKFYFETSERRLVYSSTGYDDQESTSYFLTKIETAKGGLFEFKYADEEYIDLSCTRSNTDYVKYKTKRITSITSKGYGTINFLFADRDDRGYYGLAISLDKNKRSKRINKIELRDEQGKFIKGYKLNNSDTFELYSLESEEPQNDWYNCRQKLSSIAQYDSIGNELPPYKFTYDYRLSKSRFVYFLSETKPDGDYYPYDSWTSNVGTQVYVDIDGAGNPLCSIEKVPNATAEGIIEKREDCDILTVQDYFCLTRIDYPTGAIDKFAYDNHWYSKINNTTLDSDDLHAKYIQGRRLVSKMRYGTELAQRTNYVYKLHDANYNVTGPSSGVLTNPSIHGATYYTPGVNQRGGGLMFHASRLTSGKPFNSFMGPSVCYTEVEEVTYDGCGDSLRTIHYFKPQIVSPPVNYIFNPKDNVLLRIDNNVFGKKKGYTDNMAGYNNNNYTYITYPVGDFCNIAYVVDQPIKEVFIGKNNKVRSIKSYTYKSWIDSDREEIKYGYKIAPENFSNNGYYLISVSKYVTRKTRLRETSTTSYYYDGEKCDSVCEKYVMHYNKGRTNWISNSRGGEDYGEGTFSEYFYPDDIKNNDGNNTPPMIAAVNRLIGKNMVAEPIKTIVKRNGIIVSGECRDYQMPDSIPLLKSLYKIKNTTNKYSSTPTISGDTIDYKAKMYKEGEILTYDADLNPEYVRLNDTQDRIYVWGYGGQYPIAVIDNMDGNTFQSLANLKTKILQLQSYRKIETEDKCASLRSLNASIRSMLPESAHITTYTYDPYFGMTSETDDSNLGIIYTYDTFGRLTAKHDENYKKLEEYNYHLPLQK